MHEEILEDLGLSTNESKIYLCLLSIGSSPVTNIAKECKLHRANVYDSVKKLIEKGLVTHIKKDNTTLYGAVNPHALLRIAKAKEESVKKILPQLMLSKKLAKKEQDAQIVDGVDGFINSIYDLLDYNKEFVTYGVPINVPELIKTKIPHFHKERIKRKINIRHVYNHDALNRIDFLNTLPYTEARHLPASFDSKVDTTVCGDEVLITHWVRPVVTIRIKNKVIADSYRKYFELLWKVAK